MSTPGVDGFALLIGLPRAAVEFGNAGGWSPLKGWCGTRGTRLVRLTLSLAAGPDPVINFCGAGAPSLPIP